MASLQSRLHDLIVAIKGDIVAIRDQYRDDAQIALIARAGLGTLNPNPTFVLGEYDYKNWLSIKPDYKVVTDEVNNTAGSLYLKTRTYPNVVNSDNFYPVDITKQYRARASTKLKMTGADVDPNNEYKSNYYVGTTPYDSDRQVIKPQNVSKVDNTQTFLAQPLNNGDTQIVIDDGSSWYTGTLAHIHAILIHPKQVSGKYQYVGANGRKYDEYGYSRHMMYYGTSNVASDYVDNGDGTWTIQLQSPWTLGSFEVGDAIRNSKGGGTYNYWISSKPVIANTDVWDNYSSAWGVQSNDMYDPASYFRNGVAFVKLMVLPNHLLFEQINGAGEWISKGYTTTGENGTLDIEREVWFSTIALDWRHVP